MYVIHIAISFRYAAFELEQSYDSHSSGEATLKDMVKIGLLSSNEQAEACAYLSGNWLIWKFRFCSLNSFGLFCCVPNFFHGI